MSGKKETRAGDKHTNTQTHKQRIAYYYYINLLDVPLNIQDLGAYLLLE